MPPEPRANPHLFGHEGAEAALAGAARAGRLAHAWLVTGPPGIGKATLCWRFARWLLAGMPPGAGLAVEPDHPAFRRVAAGAHPDALLLAPTEEAGKRRIIKVEEAREARRFLTLTAAEGGWRAVIVDHADTLATEGANAILKTLEEPPPRTVLLLATAAPGRLLPTIRSRCRRLDLAPLDAAAMRAALAALAPEADAQRLIPLADGAPGQALALAQGEGVELAALAQATLDGLARSGGKEAHALADRVAGRDAMAFAPFFAALDRAAAASLRQAARGGTPPAWLAGRPLAAGVEALGELRRLAEEAERLALDRRQAVLVALDRLRRG